MDFRFGSESGLHSPRPALPKSADFVVEVADKGSDVRGWRFGRRLCRAACSVGSSGLGGGATPAVLPRTHVGSWRRLRGELGQPAQVLGDRRQREFVLCAARPTQPQAAKLQDAFQVGEQHLDALSIAA
jgi:hypothetical protein